MADYRTHDSSAEALITQIGEGLLFDSGLLTASRKALKGARIEELDDLLKEVILLRQHIQNKIVDFRVQTHRLQDEIAAHDRQSKYSSIRGLLDLLKAVKSEEGSVVRLVELIRKEHEDLQRKTLNGDVGVGLYVKVADKIARTASKVVRNTNTFDEKINLVELVTESLVGINEVALTHGAKPFTGMLYNCLRACIHVDSLGGFDRDIDKFSTTAIDELKRLGPQLFAHVRESEFYQEGPDDTVDPIEAMDLWLNAADLLKFWGMVTDPDKRHGVFETCFGLYDKALQLTMTNEERAPLVISRYADAHLRLARLQFETRGIANRQEILSHCDRGTELLSRLTADGSTRPVRFNILPPKLKELEFVMLAMEVDPSIDGLKSYAVSAILELARYGSRLVTVRPWIFFHRIFSDIYDDVGEGISILEEFIGGASSAYARMRAVNTIARLRGEYIRTDRYALEALAVEETWLDDIRSNPTSISRFGRTLEAYASKGFGPKGTEPPLVLESAFPNFGYAQFFRQLAKYDQVVQSWPSDQIGESSAIDELLACFQPMFGKEQSLGLEELSKFLLRRGKSRLFNGDVVACVELLKYGISYSDDAYWYGRLIDAYRHLEDFESARKVASDAARKFPSDSQIALQEALIEVAIGNFAEAANVISNFVAEMGSQLSSCHKAVQGIYAYSMMRSDQGHVAEKIYRDMVATRPGDWRANHGLGCLLYRRGREYYAEALRVWTATILIRNKVDDAFQDWIARDCILNIAQTTKEMTFEGANGNGEITSYFNEIGESLPTAKLVALMDGMMICGGLHGKVFELVEYVASRGDDRLSKRFTQCCMSMLIEDVIRQRDSAYAGEIVKFAVKHHTLGDLFGGAKGSYVRTFLRLSTNPIIERGFDSAWEFNNEIILPDEWEAVAKLVSKSGYWPEYYSEAYQLLEFAMHRENSEIEEMLRRIIYRIAVSLRPEAKSKRILLDESYIRSFSVRCEDAISSDLTRDTYNCDPDKLRALLQEFETLERRHAGKANSWVLRGAIDGKLQHSLMTSNIRTELIGDDAFIASVTGLPSTYRDQEWGER